MQKAQIRKFRINILDIALIAVLICVVAVLVFRGELNAIFGNPAVRDIKLVLVSDDTSDENARAFRSGESATVAFGEKGEPVAALITGVRISAPADEDAATVHLELVLEIKGYRRLGVYYTEDGIKLLYGTSCSVSTGETVSEMSVENTEIIDKDIVQ